MRLVAVATSSLLLAAAGAGAAGAPQLSRSRHLWATVDICNTPSAPHTIGIRGSMPGSGVAAEKMYMRFRVEYRAGPSGKWVYVGPSADSGFVPVGAATYKARQAGRSFRIAPAAAGTVFLLRGTVDFEWRRGTSVVRHARRTTSAGHLSLAGSDPPGYSAATCSLT